MTNNPVLITVITLSGLMVPFLALTVILTEYITGFTGWEGKAAKATSSVVGLLVGVGILVSYWIPSTAPYIGSVFFALLCLMGPSGGHDLIKKFAGQVGNSKS